jgi:rare lipoprotein A
LVGAVRRAPRRTVIPATAAVVVAAVLVGVAIASLQIGPSKPVAKNDTVTVADDRNAADRAGRGELREAQSPSPSASPSPSPSKSPSPTPSKSKPSKTASTPAGVASTGTCQASFYADGARTANGEKFDPNGLTAAHKTLPFNTMVRVTNLANGKSVVVRINDRGPFVSGRCLDLAKGAFVTIASVSAGVINARYEVLK